MSHPGDLHKGPDVVNFLRHLLRHIPGKLLVLWDRAPIHRSNAVKEYLASGAAARIHLQIGLAESKKG